MNTENPSNAPAYCTWSPAQKFIHAISIKMFWLNPKWNRKKSKQTLALGRNELTYFPILYWFVVSFRSKPIKICRFYWMNLVSWSEDEYQNTQRNSGNIRRNEFVLAITFVNTNLLLCELSLDLCDSRLNVTALVLAFEHQQMRLGNAHIIFIIVRFFLRFGFFVWREGESEREEEREREWVRVSKEKG